MEDAGWKHYLRLILNILIPVTGWILLCITEPKVLKFSMPFIIGWIITMIADPLVCFLERRIELVWEHSSIVIAAAALALMVGLIYLILSRNLVLLYGFMKDLPTLCGDIERDVVHSMEKIEHLFQFLPDSIQQTWAEIDSDLGGYMGKAMEKLASPTMGAAESAARSIPAILVYLVVTILSIYFFTVDRDKMLTMTKTHTPAWTQCYTRYLRGGLLRLISGYSMTQFRIMVVVWLILIVGLLVLGVGYTPLQAFLITFLGFLPVSGTGAALIPWGLIKLLGGEYTPAADLLLVYVLTQVTRQLVQPKLVGDGMGLNPLLTLLLLYLGFKVRGTIDMVLAVSIGLFFVSLYKYRAFQGVKDSLDVPIKDVNAFRRKEQIRLQGSDTVRVENNLDMDQIRGLVWRLAFPSMLAQFVNMLYSIVDHMYIGNIEGIGAVALAGVGIYGPVIILISSFTNWVGAGGAPLISIRLGQKNGRAATRVVANYFALLTGMAPVVMAVTFLFKEPLLTFFGASPAIFPYTNGYISWYLSGTVFALLSADINQFVICQGSTKVGMKSVVLSAVNNIVLDPIFMFYFNMGAEGATIATVISQVASCIYMLIFLLGKKPLMRITFEGYRQNTMRQVLTVELSPSLIIASDSLLIIVMNVVISKSTRPGGGGMLLTCNIIVQSFVLLVTMPLGRITGETQTVLGYSYGAGRPDKIRRAEEHIVVLGLTFTAVMSIIAQVGPGYFVRIFTRESSYVEITEWAIRVYTLCVTPLVVQYAVVDGFTGMGIAKVAVSLPMFRRLVYFLSMLFLPMIFRVEKVFSAEPISDIVACMTSTVTYLLLGEKVLGDHRRF